MNFRVGQKVVCVDSRCSYIDSARACPLQKGAVYAIAGIWRGPSGTQHLQVSGFEPHFHQRRFRPVVERKTDISFAHEILRKATKPARSPAMSLHNHQSDFSRG